MKTPPKPCPSTFRAPYLSHSLLVSFLICHGINMLTGQDWPTYRHDLNRSAQTEISIPHELHPDWIYHSNHRPEPAWPLPGEETPRMHTDRALHPVIHNQTIYFGSPVDHQIRAVDTRTGALRWRFYANSAIRFAPVIADNLLYFGADDGYVYCVNAESGKQIWRHRPAPADERIIGTGNMIASWPIRTGLAVADGVIYAAAGIFPYEGLYITAINATTGEAIWTNDTAGDLSWGLQYGGMAPQGYLLLSRNTLYVPSGRGMPAAFDRATGEFKKFLSQGGKTGGSWALIDQDKLVAGVNSQGDPAKIVFDESGKREGDLFASFNGVDVVLTPTIAYTLTLDGVIAIDRVANQIAKQEIPKLDKQITDLSKKTTELRKTIKDLQAKEGEEAKQQLITQRRELTQVAALIATANDTKDQLTLACVKWQTSHGGLLSVARAGDTLFCGGENELIALNTENGALRWQATTDDAVIGLAIGDERLFASTVSGSIYSYSNSQHSTISIRETVSAQAFENAPDRDQYVQAAEVILAQAGIDKGFCLVMDSQTGQLTYELALRSDFKFILPVHDATTRREIRDHLQSTGLYGTRISVVPWGYTELPDYFANLVTSEALIRQPGLSAPAEEIARVLRPAGGIALLGTPTQSNLQGPIKRWQQGTELPALQWLTEIPGSWSKMTRGKLAGAGTWNGLYGDVGNSGSSPDTLVKGPLGVLWFGEPGSEHMLDRHARSVSPLAVNGRLFVQGMEVVMGYDAYNGTFLWKREIKGAVRSRVDVDGSNLFATDTALFVAADDRTLQLDAQTGETIREFLVPQRADQAARRWGYIAMQDGILFGSSAVPLKYEYGHLWNDMIENGKWKAKEAIPKEYFAIDARRSDREENLVDYFLRKYATPNKRASDEFKRDGYHWKYVGNFPGWLPDHTPSAVTDRMMISDALFAYDIRSGELLWHRQGHRIPQITLSIGDGRFYYVDGQVSEPEKDEAVAARERQIAEGNYAPHDESNLSMADRDFRLVTALDIRTGDVIWSKPIDLSGAGGNKLGTAFKDGRLVFFGHYSNHDQTPFAEGKLSWRRITVLDANSGQHYWSKPLNYRRRPLIVNDTLFIEPRAASLTTGEIKMRQHPITGTDVEWEFLRPGHSCGVVTATPNNLFFRSYSAAIVNLEQDSGLQLFGGTRPGCWNSMIPANGLLTMQESSAGCTCSYALRTTVTMKTKRQKGPGEWAVFISQTPTVPVSHLALNLGAPGDLRDPDGTLWFAYPRPDTSDGQGPFKDYGVKFDLHENEGTTVNRRDYRGVQFRGSEQPWLFTSSMRGLKELHIPLLDGSETGRYEVRLGMTAHPGQTKGQRVFEIALQDDVVLEEFDVLNEASGPREAVIKTFTDVMVSDQLHIRLTNKQESRPETDPIVQFIEIRRLDKPLQKVGFLNPVD